MVSHPKQKMVSLPECMQRGFQLCSCARPIIKRHKMRRKEVNHTFMQKRKIALFEGWPPFRGCRLHCDWHSSDRCHHLRPSLSVWLSVNIVVVGGGGSGCFAATTATAAIATAWTTLFDLAFFRRRFSERSHVKNCLMDFSANHAQAHRMTYFTKYLLRKAEVAVGLCSRTSMQ